MGSPFQQPQQQAPAVSRTQKFILTALLLTAAGGAYFGQRNLAALRAERDAIALARPDDRARRSTGVVTLPAEIQMPAVAVVPVEPLPAVASSPEAVRTQALGVLGELMSQRRITTLGGGGSMMALGLGSRGGESIPVYMLAPDGRLSPGFGQLFGLGEAELAVLQGTADAIKQRLDAVVKAGATVTRMDDDSFVIESQPVPEAEALRAQFINVFRSTLGEDRYRVFAQLNGEREIPPEARSRVVDGVTVFNRSGPEAFFDGFGETKRTVTVSKSNGRYSVQVRSGSGTGTSSSSSLDTVRPRMGVLADLLPPGF